MYYLSLKLIHVISSTIIFGTGLGSAFYYWRAHKNENHQAMYFAVRNVVIADWLFTTPAVIIQPITGFMLMAVLHIPITANWIVITLLLYILAGICWIPVVWIQVKMRDMLKTALASNATLPEKYYRYYRIWFALGWPAFIAVIIIFYLMLFKQLAI